MRVWLLLAAFVTGCGAPAEENGTATANQIERLSSPSVEKQDPSATARLAPLSPEDMERGGVLGAGCGFTDDAGGLLLAATDGHAIVRVQGALRRLSHAAPFGGTGGFFEDRELGVSIGRTSETATAGAEASSWPARITVTNRRTEVQQEMQGLWTCGA